MKLTSMKITAAERKEREKKYKGMAIGPGMDGDSYPYDLKIRLNDESLEKLGISTLPKVGRKVRVTCECSVTETSENASTHGGKDQKNRRMELQIEKLAVNLEATSAEEAVSDGIDEA